MQGLEFVTIDGVGLLHLIQSRRRTVGNHRRAAQRTTIGKQKKNSQS